MPTVEENKKTWDNGIYKWSSQGDEWSAAWGSPSMQWYGTILPRIQRFLPSGNILEIACGYGRWTQFLKELSLHIDILDISEECIKACRERFAKSSNISYHINDGKSLDMISNNSIDLIFSFDSLVHADETVMKAYLSQFPRILKDDGVAFIHHSNLGDYYTLYSRIRKIPKLEKILSQIGILEKTLHWREFGVNAKLIEKLAEEQNLRCISQEIINWGTKRLLIDCFSTIVKSTSSFARNNRFYKNTGFMNEVSNLHKLSSLYSIK